MRGDRVVRTARQADHERVGVDSRTPAGRAGVRQRREQPGERSRNARSRLGLFPEIRNRVKSPRAVVHADPHVRGPAIFCRKTGSSAGAWNKSPKLLLRSVGGRAHRWADLRASTRRVSRADRISHCARSTTGRGKRPRRAHLDTVSSDPTAHPGTILVQEDD
jgi:hypothetical protein